MSIHSGCHERQSWGFSADSEMHRMDGPVGSDVVHPVNRRYEADHGAGRQCVRFVFAGSFPLTHRPPEANRRPVSLQRHPHEQDAQLKGGAPWIRWLSESSRP